jgi:hypothetical protein
LGGLGDLPKRPDDRACVEKKIKEEKLKWADKKDWAGNGVWATLDGKGFWAAEIFSNFIQGF